MIGSSSSSAVTIPCPDEGHCRPFLETSFSASLSMENNNSKLSVVIVFSVLGIALLLLIVASIVSPCRQERNNGVTLCTGNSISSQQLPRGGMGSGRSDSSDVQTRSRYTTRRYKVTFIFSLLCLCFMTIDVHRTWTIQSNTLFELQRDILDGEILPVIRSNESLVQPLDLSSTSSSPKRNATTPTKQNQHNVMRPPRERKYFQQRRAVVEHLERILPGINHHGWSGPPVCTGDRLIQFQIHVLGWNRITELKELLTALQDADYTGYDIKEIPLYIHLDGGSLPEVNEIAKSFQWMGGTKYLDLRIENIGLRQMWLTSMRNATSQYSADDDDDNTLILVLEDDIVISPLYFQWLLKMVDRYARNPICRDSNLMGISLSPIVRQNMYKPFYMWSADEELISGLNDNNTNTFHHDSAYLSTVPSSWGGAYFSDRWRRFDKFVEIRMQKPFFDAGDEVTDAKRPMDPDKMTPVFLQLPNDCTTKTWSQSWKRFLVDFMYARGYFMLYPNLPDTQGLGYARQNSGIHVNQYNKNVYQVSLFNDSNRWDVVERGLPPACRDLKFIDLEHRRNSREIAMALGTMYLNAVHKSCTSETCHILLKHFARDGWSIPSEGNDGYPRICVADLYASVAAERCIPTMPSKVFGGVEGSMNGKYLVLPYELTNISRAEMIARSLGRELILVVIEPLKSEDTKGGTRFLNNSDAQGMPPTGSQNPPPPVLWAPLKGIQYNLSRVLQFGKTRHSQQVLELFQPAQSINLHHIFESSQRSLEHFLETVQHVLGACPDDLLVWDSLPDFK